MENLVFACGTLIEAKTTKALLFRNVPAEKDTLSGFRIYQIFLDGKSYPAAIKDHQIKNLIHGVSFRVNNTELEILDRYESDAYNKDQGKIA